MFVGFYNIFKPSHLRPAAGQQGLLSSGSGHSATGSPCGAILWSLLIGWSVGGPVRQRTASGGCKRCRRRRLRWCARVGWGWWCGWACCSWKALTQRQTLESHLNMKYFICLFSTHSCRSKIDGSPFPPPDYPAPPARTRSSRDHRSCCEHTQEGQNVKYAILSLSTRLYWCKRKKKQPEYYTDTLFSNCCRELQYWENHPWFHIGQKENSLLFIV